MPTYFSIEAIHSAVKIGSEIPPAIQEVLDHPTALPTFLGSFFSKREFLALVPNEFLTSFLHNRGFSYFDRYDLHSTFPLLPTKTHISIYLIHRLAKALLDTNNPKLHILLQQHCFLKLMTEFFHLNPANEFFNDIFLQRDITPFFIAQSTDEEVLKLLEGIILFYPQYTTSIQLDYNSLFPVEYRYFITIAHANQVHFIASPSETADVGEIVWARQMYPHEDPYYKLFYFPSMKSSGEITEIPPPVNKLRFSP